MQIWNKRHPDQPIKSRQHLEQVITKAMTKILVLMKGDGYLRNWHDSTRPVTYSTRYAGRRERLWQKLEEGADIDTFLKHEGLLLWHSENSPQ